MKLIRPHCIIDVGANSGNFCIEVAKKNPTVTVIAFEPIPQLFESIQRRKVELGLENLLVRPEAILDTEGSMTLKIADHSDMGVSSLLGFDLNNITQDEYWSVRNDLFHESEMTVKVSRLDNILAELDVAVVDFIKVDAQGVDLRVLQSLGKFPVRAGMVESPTTTHKSLYVGEPDLRANLNSLTEMGYEIWDIKPNDPASAEVNVFFTLKGENLRQIESDFGLLDVDIYGGKHYWAHNGKSRQIAEAKAESHAIQNYLASVDAKVASLTNQLNAEREATQRADLKLSQQDDLVRQLGRDLEQIRSSKSWRYSAFLRNLTTVFFSRRK
jgi:FkbM family methyltransferase